MDRFEDVAGAEREGFDFQAFNAGVAPMEAGVGDPAHGAEEQLLPSLSEIGLVPPRIGSTIRHVPKRLNTAFTELKTRALREAGQRNDLTAWTKLLMLPICVLRRIPSPRGGKRRKQHFRKQLTAIIKTRIERWKNGDLAGLWEEVMSEVEEDGIFVGYISQFGKYRCALTDFDRYVSHFAVCCLFRIALIGFAAVARCSAHPHSAFCFLLDSRPL